MKKLLIFLSFLICFTISSQAQIGEKLSYGVSANLMYPQEFFERYVQAGLALNVNGAYNFNDKISIGLEYHRGLTTGHYNVGGGIININNFRFNTFSPRVWYKFNIKDFKPYASVGYGYSVIQDIEDGSNLVLGTRKNRSLMGEVGLAYKGFNAFANTRFYNNNGSYTTGFSPFVAELFVYYYEIGVGYTRNF